MRSGWKSWSTVCYMKVFLSCLGLLSVVKTTFEKMESFQRYQHANICRKTATDHILKDLKGCLDGVIFPEAKGLEPTRAEPPSLSHQLFWKRLTATNRSQPLFSLWFFFFLTVVLINDKYWCLAMRCGCFSALSQWRLDQGSKQNLVLLKSAPNPISF